MKRLALICALLAGAAATARAESTDVERARLYVELGIKHFVAGEHAKALDAFRNAEPQAEALGDPAGLRYNIARCLEELGRDAEAHAAFERYLLLPDRPDQQEAAREKMDALARRLWGRLNIDCDVPGVRLSAPGLTPTEADCPQRWLRVPPGAYTVEGVSPDGVVGQTTVSVEAGVALAATLRMPGQVQVTGPAGAQVTVDGEGIGALPLAPWTLPPGEHVIALDADAGAPVERTVTVEAGRALTVDLQAAAPPVAPPPVEPPPSEPPPGEPPPSEPPRSEPVAPAEAQPTAEAAVEPAAADLDRGHVDLTLGSGAAFYDGETYRQHVNLGFALAFGAGPVELGVETLVLVESPLAVALRPELRLPLGVAYLRAGGNLMVVPDVVFGALLGAGVQVPLSPRLALHLGLDGTLWPTASVTQVEGRTGLAVRF